MHIEPGIVTGAKLLLSYGTASLAVGIAAKFTLDAIRERGLLSLLARSLVATLLVFCCFEVLPHHPVGVSEVHLILGTTLLLMLGTAPAVIGLGAGLLAQGLFFAPFDLPQYGMNMSTLLFPLFAIHWLAKKIIPASTAYVDLTYGQALKLSLAYQGGIVTWVGFWAFYGQGFGSANIASVASFGLAYMSVVLIEPLADLAVLAAAKGFRHFSHSPIVEYRLFHTAD